MLQTNLQLDGRRRASSSSQCNRTNVGLRVGRALRVVKGLKVRVAVAIRTRVRHIETSILSVHRLNRGVQRVTN